MIEVHSSLGEPPQLLKSYAGCDATYLDINGIAAVDYGTGMQLVHSTEEFIKIDDLVKTALFVEGMVDVI